MSSPQLQPEIGVQTDLDAQIVGVQISPSPVSGDGKRVSFALRRFARAGSVHGLREAGARRAAGDGATGS